jgi:AcrR family transcriptional regulator
MFKAKSKQTAKSEATKKKILETALNLFREKGFDDVTMRDIAQDAEMALGAAYYYFPSKEALVVAYYEHVQAEHTRQYREAVAAGKPNMKQRLSIALHSKIDIIQDDRKFLAAPFRYTGTPDHPLSFLGPATAGIRGEAIDVFREVIAGEDFPADLEKILPVALWAMHMGVMLYFLYDKSAGAKKTRRLIDNAVDFTVKFIAAAKFPLFKPIRSRVIDALKEADLMPA